MRKSYTGVLAEPMKLNLENPAAGLEDHFERLIALKEHYEVPDLSADSLMQLVLKLARDHVPGFQLERPPKPTGPKPKHPHDDLIIFSYICAAKEDGKTVSAACGHLEKKGLVGLSASGIRQRYYLVKNSGDQLDRLIEYVKIIGKSQIPE